MRYFKSKENEDVLIVQGIEMVKLDGKKGENVREMDFLVINFTYQYILNIEVKKWLGQIEGKSKNIIDEAIVQLESNKAKLEDWFGADLKGDWRFVSALYCKAMHTVSKYAFPFHFVLWPS